MLKLLLFLIIAGAVVMSFGSIFTHPGKIPALPKPAPAPGTPA